MITWIFVNDLEGLVWIKASDELNRREISDQSPNGRIQFHLCMSNRAMLEMWEHQMLGQLLLILEPGEIVNQRSQRSPTEDLLRGSMDKWESDNNMWLWDDWQKKRDVRATEVYTFGIMGISVPIGFLLFFEWALKDRSNNSSQFYICPIPIFSSIFNYLIFQNICYYYLLNVSFSQSNPSNTREVDSNPHWAGIVVNGEILNLCVLEDLHLKREKTIKISQQLSWDTITCFHNIYRLFCLHMFHRVDRNSQPTPSITWYIRSYQIYTKTFPHLAIVTSILQSDLLC